MRPLYKKNLPDDNNNKSSRLSDDKAADVMREDTMVSSLKLETMIIFVFLTKNFMFAIGVCASVQKLTVTKNETICPFIDPRCEPCPSTHNMVSTLTSA